jgi:hypothetical protein
VNEKEVTMIEKIARRAGGFASTTAARWVGAGVDTVADVAPGGGNGNHRSGGRLLAGAAGAVALLSSSKTVRSGLERGLRTVSKAVRPTPSANGNGNGGKDLSAKTRAELYELAKKADLPGRSAMSKDELAKALKH